MTNLPNFKIQDSGSISGIFLQKKISCFHDACKFVANLNYGRNADKNNLNTIVSDNCGTCSTKHALLKQLADENGYNHIKLVLGIFKMDSGNTKDVSQTLKKNKLEYIPEAHNYLKFENKIYDFTTSDSIAEDFENDLITEIEIEPMQISAFKVEFHKTYLQKWLQQNPKIKFNIEELWEIREQCIRDLQT